jgi:hypothetical protein
MYAYAHFDNRCASVMSDDNTGITLVYPGGSSGGSLTIKTDSNLGMVKVNNDYNVALEATGGMGSYQWSLIGGQLPPGLQFSQSGFAYGKANTPGTFTFSAQVKDSSNNTAQRSFSLVVQPPNPAPVVMGVEYRKKKVFVSGVYFDSDATIFVDGVPVDSKFDGTELKTKKKAKLPQGVHVVWVVNEDGKRSNDFTFAVQ